jgi:CheY-like chemotaxis protein
VLVVEDDPAVAELTVNLLERFGYTVLQAPDADTALDLCHRRGEQPVDLLLSDVIMPGMDGAQLADQIRTLWPEVRVLFMTAYSEEALREQGVDNLDPELVLKPFKPLDLVERVRNVLDAAPRTPL